MFRSTHKLINSFGLSVEKELIKTTGRLHNKAPPAKHFLQTGLF